MHQLLAAESRAGPQIGQGLRRIIAAVPRRQEELKIYSTSKRVVKATAAVFAQVICYLVNAKAFLLKNKLRRAVDAVPGSKLDHCLTELEKAEENLGREIRAVNGQSRSCQNTPPSPEAS